MRKFFAMTMFVSTLVLAGCDIPPSQPTADEKVAAQTEQTMKEGLAQVGLPSIVNWNEKRMAKLIYELRDDPKLQTYTYVKDMNGGYRLLCESVGFGLPYATQYTNPQKLTDEQIDKGYLVMPQPEPNGLFMPDSAEATWIICKSPKDGKPSVIYVEERTTITQFPMPDSALAK